ncbi:transposase domain-containing protein [Gigaspora margarita]|uniref:Transposase domain-containing protein n=1 Tax=Gigaspora margarita TaxID=4874 RepID=A0A8H4A655_GIGMA|nr:transposase domain-containing protein [Gigaspora margarita]
MNKTLGLSDEFISFVSCSKCFDDILCDIYNGKIWKTFKDELFGEDSALFFYNEKADSHLGLIVNLDWFQLFDGVLHSTGVLYVSIVNLPRDIQFKHENMLVLGILPGLNKVSLYKINHYFSLVVDELEALWHGMTLNSIAEFSERRMICAALILISCDILAARKLCRHISALVSCHRCEKSANYINRHFNFGSIQNMDKWFIQKDLVVHQKKALK